MTHQRRAPRKDCLSNVKVYWCSNESPLSDSGTILDRSATGFGVKVQSELLSGTIVAIQQGFSKHFGVVKNCSKVRGGFFIGVELCEVAAKPSESIITHSDSRFETEDGKTASHSDTLPKLSGETVEAERTPSLAFQTPTFKTL